VIVVVGIHVFARMMCESSTPSGPGWRAWGRSIALGVLFFVVAWLLPWAIVNGLHLKNRPWAVLPSLAGLALFAWTLGHTTLRNAAVRAGIIAGSIATACFTLLVLAWMMAVGIHFLGPGLI